MSECKAKSCGNSTRYSCDDYCSYHEKCLSKLREYKSISNIREIETFETWFNGNCGYVINCDYSSSSSYPYYVWIVIYEPKQWNKNISEDLSVIRYDNYGSLGGARDKAQDLRYKLKYSSNPIFGAYRGANNYESFSSVITSPYVKDNQVGTSTKTTDVPLFYVNYESSTPTDLNRHFKVLDIVWVKCVDCWVGKRFYHVGFFLGDNKICHFSRENDAVETTDWGGFLRNTSRKIIRYHPVIPFKNYKDIIRQAVWAKDNGFRRGNYNLPNRNCEHFTNMLVYGINFSQQVREREGELVAKASVQSAGIGATGGVIGGASIVLAPFTFGLSLIPGAVGVGASVAGIVDNAENHGILNNGKTSVCLESEIRDTNGRLGKKSDWETNKYEEQYLQEVPSKEYCRIM